MYIYIQDEPLVAHDISCIILVMFDLLGGEDIKLEPGWDAVGSGKKVFVYNNDDGSAIITKKERT